MVGFACGVEIEGHAFLVALDVLGAVLGLALHGEGRDLLALGGCRLDIGKAVAVRIDVGVARDLEQQELGGEIVLKIRMLDVADVVRRDVQKHAVVKMDAADAVVFQRLAGNLDDHARQAIFHGVVEIAIEIDVFRRRQLGRRVDLAVVDARGRREPSEGQALFAGVGVENVL